MDNFEDFSVWNTPWKTTEKFLKENLEPTAFVQIKDPKMKSAKDLFRFGNEHFIHRVDHALAELYFKTHEWNELYWDLYYSIGNAWYGCLDMDAWRSRQPKVCEPEKGKFMEVWLTATNQAQRLLFWCIEHDYTLDDLRQMIETKTIIK